MTASQTFEQWLQSRLTAHGYPVGAIDGVIGPATIGAIRAFQAANAVNGVVVNGRPDGPTVMALRMQSSYVKPDIRLAILDRQNSEPIMPSASSPPVWPLQKDCTSFYGPVGTSQTQIEIPFDMFLAWDKSVRVKKITVHSKVAESATRVFQRIGGTYSTHEKGDLGIDIFGGSLNVRRMRGGTAYSMHSWGIAIDFDPERNQLHWGAANARLAKPDAFEFWRAWEQEGWVSLGRSRDYDWMHVQAARLA
jgi:peptidoglycan hydrolase-like protein with peptidoglycan-binding domain